MKKKKLVFVLNNFLVGGTERVLLEILKNFDRNSFKISIIPVFESGSMESDFKKLGIPIFFLLALKIFFVSFFKNCMDFKYSYYSFKINSFLKKANQMLLLLLYIQLIFRYLYSLVV